MKPPKDRANLTPHSRRSAGAATTLAVLFAAATVVSTQAATSGGTTPPNPTERLHHPMLGGIDPRPNISSITTTQGMQLKAFGWGGGPFQLQMKTNATSTNWVNVGDPFTTNFFSAHLDQTNSSQNVGIFRVVNTNPNLYGGVSSCSGCHWEVHDLWIDTAHAKAHDSLAAIGMGNNQGCLPCHSVGFNMANGFKVGTSMTNYMAGVQCESCHGPSGGHRSDTQTLAKRPAIELSAKVCGGCHTDAHHPTFDEWEHAHHAGVDDHVEAYFRDPVTGPGRQLSCGPCHSGATRLAMLKSMDSANVQLPTGEEAASAPIACVVCHDPHYKTPHGAHLRNPLSSTNAFNYSTATTTSFYQQYYVQGGQHIQICGQCHNARGAVATDTSRPPHHSPQYNILTGTLGITDPSNTVARLRNSRHTRLDKQCVSCHMHPKTETEPTEEHPNYTGHKFEPQYSSCTTCHEDQGEAMVHELADEIKARIQTIKGLLDTWGQTKSPEALRTKYGALAWEYNTAGQISSPNGDLRGPTSQEQNSVPLEIKQARFNLYLVEHDGSFGTHNPRYVKHLLQVAEEKVNALLAQ